MSDPAAPEVPVLLLASASPRRRELLARLGVAFDVAVADVEEWEAGDADPAALVAHNAALKADALSGRFPARAVLAADTTVALEGEVLNKPADLDHARAMLARLSGQTHTVYTGVHLRWAARGVEEACVVTSEVTFKPFGAEVIERYIALVNPLDKAGAYGIQEGRELIIERWSGQLENIMGLPLEEVGAMVRRHGLG